jgi:hypothetical protein
MKPEQALRIIDEKQSLTRQYANHQHQKGGLGYVPGGLVLLAISLLALQSKPGLMPALAMWGFTLLWSIGKETLGSWLYTPLGTVRGHAPAKNRARPLYTIMSILMITGISLFSLLYHVPDFFQMAFFALLLVTAACTTWFCLRRPGEWLLGLLLLSISAFTALGNNVAILQWLLLLSFIAALAFIVQGIREHLQFRVLIEQLQTGQQAALWKRYISSRTLSRQHPSNTQQQWPLFYVLTASIASTLVLTHSLFAAPFCAGTILLLALQKRVALQARLAPVPISYTARRSSCSMMLSTNSQQR